MIWQFPYLSGLILFSALISLILAINIWGRRPARGAIYLAGLMLCVAIWQLGYSLELSSESLAGMVFWKKIQYIGNVFVPLLWLAFALDYIDRPKWLTIKNFAFFGTIPLLSLIAVWTNELHRFYWRGLETTSSFGYTFLIENPGPWAYVHTIYFYLLLLLGSILLIQTLTYGWIYYRGQTIALMIGVLVPWIANVVDILGFDPTIPLELTPLALTISGLAIGLGVFRYRLLDIIPVAREAIIESMTDGMIVLDNQYRVIDINQAAEKIFGSKASVSIGQTIDTIWSGWPNEVTLPLGRLSTAKEIEIDTQDGRQVYDLRLSPLFNRRGYVTGRLLVLRDVTKQRRTEGMLQRRDEILEAISFAAEQFLRERNWQRVIPEVLGRLGKATEVHRVFLFEVPFPAQADSAEERYIWNAEKFLRSEEAVIDLPVTLGAEGWRKWLEILEKGQVIHGPLDELPGEGRARLAQNEIRSIIVLPIFVEERLWGSVGLADLLRDRFWTPIEIDALRVLAEIVGAAIQREHLYAQSQEDAEELASLYRASTRLLRAGSDLQSLAYQIVQTVTREFASAYGSVLLVDEERQELVMIAQAGRMQLQDILLPLDGPGLTVASFNLGQAIYVSNVRDDPRYVSASDYTFSELVFPLQSGDKVIGVLNLESPEIDAFDDKDQRIVAAFAENAALALDNVRLLDAARTHARHMMLLNEITRTAIESADLQKVIETMVDRLPGLISADEAVISLWDQEYERTILGAVSKNVRGIYESEVPEKGEITVTERVMRENRLIVVEDVRDSIYISQRIAAHYPTRSLIALPLIAGDLKYGVAIISFNQPHKFTKIEIELCEQAGRQIALAISKAWSLDIASHRAQEAENLRKATVALSSSLELQKVLVRILVHLEQVVNFDSACIFLLERNSLRAVAGRGFPDMSKVIGKSYPFDLLLLENQHANHPVILEDAQKDKRFNNWGGTTYVHGWMGVPLWVGGKKIGYLTLDSREVGAFDESTANLAQAFATQAAVAIENSQLFESAKQRAREAETLRQAGAIVASTLDQDKAIQLILEQLERVVPYDSASVQLLKGNVLEIVGGRGWQDERVVVGMCFPVPGDNPNTLVIEQKQPQIIRDTRRKYTQFNQKPHDSIRSWLGVPLIVREKVIGMLSVDSKQLEYFTPDHARLATAFADQVAIVMENARLYSAEQHRVMQLDALRATAADISAELELPRLLETILERAVTLLTAKGGELGLYDEENDEVVIVVSHNMRQDFTGTHLALGEGAMGAAAERLEPLIIDNYLAWEGRSSKYIGGEWHSVMASPLMVHGRLVGVIGVVDEDPDRLFSSADLELLNMFAYQSAIAVENANLFKEAKEAAERRAVLYNVSQEIVAASLEPEQIYATIHKAAGQLMPAEAFVITLLDRKSGEVDAVYLVDRDERVPSRRISSDHGLSGLVLASGNSICIEDYDLTKDTSGIHFGFVEHTRSIVAVPLHLGEEIIGMISAQCYRPNAYTVEDRVLLEMLASHAAIALENTRLFGEVQYLAITDPLTNLYNRRGLETLGHREIDRSRRFGRPLSAIMLDLDDFKIVNDTYGHSIGDQVLVGLADICREIVRDVDLVVRYGGEEFLILLPEADLDAAVQVADRLRYYVEKNPIQTDAGEIEITISLGAVSFDNEMEDLERVIDRADKALYAAKQAGRNRVIVDRLDTL